MVISCKRKAKITMVILVISDVGDFHVLKKALAAIISTVSALFFDVGVIFSCLIKRILTGITRLFPAAAGFPVLPSGCRSSWHLRPDDNIRCECSAAFLLCRNWCLHSYKGRRTAG